MAEETRELARCHSVDFTHASTSFSPNGDPPSQRRWDSAYLVEAAGKPDPSFLSTLFAAKSAARGSQLMAFTAVRVKRSLSKAGSLFSLVAGGSPTLPRREPHLEEAGVSLVCKLCLEETSSEDEYSMKGCSCVFCKEVRSARSTCDGS